MITFTIPEEDRDGLSFMKDLYQKYARLMYAAALDCMPGSQDCEDIVQDAVESLCRKVHMLMDLPTSALTVYIVSTVKNKARDFLRHQAVVSRHITALDEVSLDRYEAPVPTPETLVEIKEEAADLYKVWHRLPGEDRELLYRKYVLGQSNEELAEIFHCKKDNIRMRLMRAKRKAAALMKGGRTHDTARTLA